MIPERGRRTRRKLIEGIEKIMLLSQECTILFYFVSVYEVTVIESGKYRNCTADTKLTELSSYMMM